MATVAQLSGVGVRRGRKWLLKDIDWKVDDEQRWVIIGPNGAGKTTMLQLLSTQMFPTEGTVEVLEQRMGEIDVFELRPRIGMVSIALAEKLPRSERVADVVVSAAYGVIGKWREDYDYVDYRRAVDLMTYMNVDHLASRTFGTLSEGERKRTQIARALMSDPEILLLDEPAAGLDLAGRESLVASLADLCADPKAPTTVLVTHHLEEIPAGVTHALCLKDGGVVAAGPIAATLTNEVLSETFGIPIIVSNAHGRWSARQDPAAATER